MRFYDMMICMKRMFIILFFIMGISPVVADETGDVVANAEQIFDAVRITCSGISDEISKVSNISKANTAVTAVGTVAAGGALVAGVKKSQEEEEIDKLIEEMCARGGCDPDAVEKMSLEEFYNTVIVTFAKIDELREKIDKSKKLGNWRTGLMAGTIGTNLASAIMSGLNINQSDLVQHISACNEMIQSVPDIERELKKAGVNPNEYNVVKKLSSDNCASTFNRLIFKS